MKKMQKRKMIYEIYRTGKMTIISKYTIGVGFVDGGGDNSGLRIENSKNTSY
jgi:hypothetical protein